MRKRWAVFLLAVLLSAQAPIQNAPPLAEHRRDNHAERLSGSHGGNAETQPPPTATNNETYYVKQEAGQHEQQPGWFGIPFDGWTAIATFGLFFATTGLFIFTYRLWRANKELIQNAAKTADRQLRPYVFIKEAKLVAAPGAGPWEIHLRFKNYGATPAAEVMVIVDRAVRTDPPPGEVIPFTADVNNGSPISLPPQALHTCRIPMNTLGNQWTVHVAAGRKVYLWGCFIYRYGTEDAFTNFQMVHALGHAEQLSYTDAGNDFT